MSLPSDSQSAEPASSFGPPQASTSDSDALSIRSENTLVNAPPPGLDDIEPFAEDEFLDRPFGHFKTEILDTRQGSRVPDSRADRILGYMPRMEKMEMSSAVGTAKKFLCVALCYYMIFEGGYGGNSARYTKWHFGEDSASAKTLTDFGRRELKAYGDARIKSFKDYPKEDKATWKEMKADWEKDRSLLDHCRNA